MEVFEHLFGEIRVQNLVVGIFDVLAVTLEIFAQKLLLVLVFAAGIPFVEPEVGVFLGDDRRHEP